MKRRHAQVNHPGVAHFITTTVVEWLPIFREPTLAKIALSDLEKYRKALGVPCGGYVLMPHHLHMLLIQLDNGMTVSNLMMTFKKASSAHIRRAIEDGAGESTWLKVFRLNGDKYHPNRPRFQLWMDGYDDVAIDFVDAVHTKLNYMHENPVRADLCASPEEWPYSSCHDYLYQANRFVQVDCSYAGMLIK